MISQRCPRLFKRYLRQPVIGSRLQEQTDCKRRAVSKTINIRIFASGVWILLRHIASTATVVIKRTTENTCPKTGIGEGGTLELPESVIAVKVAFVLEKEPVKVEDHEDRLRWTSAASNWVVGGEEIVLVPRSVVVARRIDDRKKSMVTRNGSCEPSLRQNTLQDGFCMVDGPCPMFDSLRSSRGYGGCEMAGRV